MLVAVFGPVVPRSAAEESPETARISIVWDDTAAAAFLQTTLERKVVNVAAYPRTLDNTQNTNDEVGQKAAPSSNSVYCGSGIQCNSLGTHGSWHCHAGGRIDHCYFVFGHVIVVVVITNGRQFDNCTKSGATLGSVPPRN